MAETKLAWRSLILFKCNAAWNRHIDERCHITRTKWYIRAADASSFQTFGISAPVYQTSKLDRSIDRSIDKPRPREENNSPLGERNFASMFSFPVTRPQTSFPAVSNVYLVPVFRPSSPPSGKGRNLRAVGIEVEESFAEEAPLDSFNLDDTFFFLLLHFVGYLNGFYFG